jgi:hypothetical protein
VQGLAQNLGEHAWAWLAVLALGAYHGLNPGMGWLLAVSNGMHARRAGAVWRALPPIACGHFLAMAAALLPFALLGLYLGNLDEIRAAAGLLLLAIGAYKLLSPRHPRFLARIGPTQITWWSFLMATAHGAGLMLVPVALGLCTGSGGVQGAHRALLELGAGSLALALLAATAHTVAMVATGGAIAWAVYRYAGVAFLRRSWLNFDLLWALLLVGVGALALASALGS